MFCCLCFKFDFYQIVWPSWGHLGFHLAPFFRNKKTLPKFASKKGDPHLKTSPYVIVQGLLETPPLITLYKGRRLACALLNSNNSIELEFKLDFSSSSNCGSKSCPSLSSKSKTCSKLAAWIGFDCKSFENNSKKWKGLISKLNAGDLTRSLAKGPAN